jgi:hypothetical protein
VPVQIARIETVEMTPGQYEEAVHALAVLVSHYWRAHPEVFREDDPVGSGISLPGYSSRQPLI